MEDGLFRKIVDDLRTLGFEGEILLAPWSEPLMDERLSDWAAYIRQRLPESRIKLQSNGDLLTPSLFRRLIRAGVDEIDVSDHYRIEGDRYLPDPPRAAFRTKQAATGSDGDRIHFHQPNLARMLGVERFHNRSGMVPLRNLVHYGEVCGPCRFPESYLSVNFRGEVLLCARQWRDTPVFGDLRRSSVREIWRSPEFREIRSHLRKGVFELDLCRACAFGDLPDPARLHRSGEEAGRSRRRAI
jgi:2-deoxy-scyllo-inosamine dehydrogenase (SAM-dependent)